MSVVDGPLYLDHNATTPVRPAARDAVARALELTGNASSVHAAGHRVRRAIDEARRQLAGLVGADAAEVIFTSGGTEANALALAGCGRGRYLVSAVEHVSVIEAAAAVAGARRETLPVDEDGVIDLAALEQALSRDPTPALVSVMLANNETGVIQPLAEVSRLARRHGALVHADAVQAAGRIPVDLAALGVHMLSLSAHKLGGPQGVGALVVADGVALAPTQVGGGQERHRRAGTENAPGIAGFGAAAAAAGGDLVRSARLARWRDRLERRVRAIAEGSRVYGCGRERLPNTSCFSVAGVDSETQVIALDLAGVAVSAGSACSSGKVGPSHVLAAMGVARSEAECAIRVSLGWTSEAGDVDRFVEAWSALLVHVAGLGVASAA
jgi:cysteine desulfurase